MNKLKIAFIIVLLAFASVSLFQGFNNAITRSQDFQWSPARLFSQKIDPYKHYLDGNKDSAIIQTQIPNYLHGLYPIFTPLAILDFYSAKIVFAILNITIALLISVLIGKYYGFTNFNLILLCGIFFCSTPLRNAISNGQTSILIFAAFSAQLFSTNKLVSNFLSGLSYFKYSFAPPLAMQIFFRKGFTSFLITLIPSIAGFLIFWMVVGGEPIQVLLSPLQVATRSHLTPGDADVMTLVQKYIPSGSSIYLFLFYSLPILISVFGAFLSYKFIKNPLVEFAIICALALLSFKHLNYDFVFLLPAVAIAIKNIKLADAKLILLITFYFWFGEKILYSFHIQFWTIINFLFLLSLIILLFKINRNPLENTVAGINKKEE